MWLAYGGGPQGIIHMETVLFCLWLPLVKSSVTDFFLSKRSQDYGASKVESVPQLDSFPHSLLPGAPFKKCHLQVGWHKRPSQMLGWGMCCLSSKEYSKVLNFSLAGGSLKTIFPWPPEGFEHCKSAHLISRNFIWLVCSWVLFC